MTSVDKAAIAWSIAIIAVGIGFSVAGLSFAQVNSTTTSVSQDVTISIISSFEYEIIHSDVKPTTPPEPVDETSESYDESVSIISSFEYEIIHSDVEPTTTPDPVVEPPEPVDDTPVPVIEPPYPPPSPTTVVIPGGTGVPGCEETRSCYDPYRITVGRYSTITWINVDSAAHTVTSGSPTNGPDGAFDSGMLMVGESYSYKFDRDGAFNYFCMVHPWMLGQVVVQRDGVVTDEEEIEDTDEEIRIEVEVDEIEHEERDSIKKKYYDAMKVKRHDALIRIHENPNIPERIRAMIMEKHDIYDDRMDEIKMKYKEKHGDLTDEKRTELKIKFKDHMTSMKFTMSDERKSEIHDRIVEMKIFKSELRERASEMTDEEKQGLRAEFIEKAKDMRLAWISPRAQMHAGIDVTEIECREGFSLVMKESNGKAMCLKADTALRMIDRGIAVPA